MEAGTHSILISEQLQELGHEVIVANVRELRAISHSHRKSDQVDAEKLARYARLDPKILHGISSLRCREKFWHVVFKLCRYGVRITPSHSGSVPLRSRVNVVFEKCFIA
jgi:transposase